MGDKNHRRRENVDLDQVRVTGWWGKHGRGEGKKKGKEAKQGLDKNEEDGKARSGRSEGQGIFFCESSHVRLAGCPRHTAEKSI